MKDKLVKIELHKGDLPAGIDFGGSVAIDTETMGLLAERDKLCLVQLSAGDGVCHLVQVSDRNYEAPNLKALLTDKNVTKIFHFARFDIAMLRRYLDIECQPIYCTKIASKLVRTYTDSHGLKDLCREILGIQLSKAQQSSDWGAETLSDDQIHYAALDVLYLHRLRESLDEMLTREGRKEMAQACFDFLPVRGDLDLAGWRDEDIFAH